jgi:hypothetical protein
METYKLIHIDRKTEKLEADSLRLGKLYHKSRITEGLPAILIHKDDPNKALVTTPVLSITELEGSISFSTNNTTYTLVRVK